MEVSQIANLDSHVVIGGGVAQGFGMDDSPELYALLSDKIYRDKKRAAMRETICNAWDAHIMVGKLDVPVEITLSDTEIVIRDFGPGIPEHLMHPIYCVYGKSTKVKDDKQTGGFGLGSKSPFAVTDHFNVNNYHDGWKTVYALSRGGAATNGKPDIRPMVRVPTTESGLAVTIPLRSPKDRAEFELHIRAVVRLGGMLVNLNGQPIARHEYSVARKTEYCVLSDNGDFPEGNVYVLYGTVMYPLTTTDAEINTMAARAHQLCGAKSVLVLIAPPNSIGVVPSREALSFSEQTDNTLKRLLAKAERQITLAIEGAKTRQLQESLNRHGPQALEKVFERREDWPGLRPTPDMIADHYVRTGLGQTRGDDRRKLCKLAQRMYRDDRRFWRRTPQTYTSIAENDFQRTSMPFLRVASKLSLLRDLMLFDVYRAKHDILGPKTRKIGEFVGEGRVLPILCVAKNLRDLRPMLNIQGRSFKHPEKQTFLGGIVMRQWTEKNLKALREACEKFSIKLDIYDYEEAKRLRDAKPKRQKTEEVYSTLDDLMKPRGSYDATPSSCQEPEYFLVTWVRNEIYHSPIPSGSLVKQIAEKYPNTVLITTKPQEEKLRKAGVRNLAEVAAERLTALTKIREVVYGEAIRNDRMITSKDNVFRDSVPDTVLKLAKMDMRIAKLLFPDRAKPGEAHAEASLLYDFLNTVEDQHWDANNAAKTATSGIREACLKTFPPIERRVMERRFYYLDLICGADVVGCGETIRNERRLLKLIEMIKFLQRQHTKSKLTSTKPTNSDWVAITLKEAA